jgi:hypothetical protein
VYEYIKDNCSYQDKFNLYSGIVLNFSDVSIGPDSVFDDYDIYSTGACIITGDYSAMASGLTINLYNNSSIHAKGGSTSRLAIDSDPVKTGKNAVFVNCSGKLNLNLDNTSFIVAGAGAGDNITLRDVVNVKANKFDTLKDSFRQDGLCSSGIYDNSTATTYDKSQVATVFAFFNNTDLVINTKTTSSVGASIFYEFFDTGILPSGLVYGSPGASFGSGFSKANLTYTEPSELNKATAPYHLWNLLKPQSSLYKIKNS